MRHLSTYRFTYMIAALLVAGCALFAWIRSHDIWIAPRAAWPRPEASPPPAPAPPGPQAETAAPDTVSASEPAAPRSSGEPRSVAGTRPRSEESERTAPGEPRLAVTETSAATAERLKRGADFYRRHCRMCHGALPHLGELARVRGSREYLVDLLLNGLEGRIPIRGTARDVYHPPFDSESDGDLASTLDHMFASWGNDAARPADWSGFEAAEVARARRRAWTPDEMRGRRLALEPK
jgi:cytochrome c5